MRTIVDISTGRITVEQNYEGLTPVTEPDMVALRAEAYTQVVAMIDARELQLTGHVPINERSSWSVKAAAARVWLADQTKPVPVLIAREAAAARETNLQVAQRIVAREDAWLPVTATHTGYRRVAFDSIAAARTPEAIRAAMDVLREALG